MISEGTLACEVKYLTCKIIWRRISLMKICSLYQGRLFADLYQWWMYYTGHKRFLRYNVKQRRVTKILCLCKKIHIRFLCICTTVRINLQNLQMRNTVALNRTASKQTNKEWFRAPYQMCNVSWVTLLAHYWYELTNTYAISFNIRMG